MEGLRGWHAVWVAEEHEGSRERVKGVYEGWASL